MDNSDGIRKKLETHKEELAKKILGKTLLRSEYGGQIFSPRIRDELEDRLDDGTGQHGAMSSFIDALLETGPEGYGKFINGLIVTGHFEPVRLLEPDIDIVSRYRQLDAELAEKLGTHCRIRSAPSPLDAHVRQVTVGGDGVESCHSEKSDGISSSCLSSKRKTEELDIQKTSDSACGADQERTPHQAATGAPVKSPETIAKALKLYNGLRKDDPNHFIYKMEENPRGLVLIIENDEFDDEKHSHRHGSDRDSTRLKHIFELLYFNVIHEINLGISDMRSALTQFTKLSEHGEACFVFILSHGDQVAKKYSTKDVIISYEGRMLETEWIIKQFSNASAPKLAGKPKILAFQACRGHQIDELPQARLQTDNYHCWTDLMILHATVPGFVAIRNQQHGSWFIQDLCDVIKEQGNVLHFKKIADETIRRVKKRIGGNGVWIQAPACELRGGFEKLYLNPGLSAVDDVSLNKPLAQEDTTAASQN